MPTFCHLYKIWGHLRGQNYHDLGNCRQIETFDKVFSPRPTIPKQPKTAHITLLIYSTWLVSGVEWQWLGIFISRKWSEIYWDQTCPVRAFEGQTFEIKCSTLNAFSKIKIWTAVLQASQYQIRDCRHQCIDWLTHLAPTFILLLLGIILFINTWPVKPFTYWAQPGWQQEIKTPIDSLWIPLSN